MSDSNYDTDDQSNVAIWSHACKFLLPNGAMFSSVEETCTRKKLAQETMTHAQKTKKNSLQQIFSNFTDRMNLTKYAVFVVCKRN